MLRVIRLYMLLGAAVLSFFSGCEYAADEISAADRPLRVTVTTGMIADTARNIGGALVQVEQLMGPGVDPHLYKATHSDLNRLSNADLVLYNGLHLEGRMVDILARMNSFTHTLALAEKIPADKLRSLEDYPGNQDPHVWMDLSLWQYVVEAIRDIFIELDPENADYFKNNTDAYLQAMDELDTYTKDAIAGIPASARVLVTAHDAFGYFGAAYGIEVMGLQGISTAAEYGLQDVERMVNTIIARGIPAIFVETSVSTRGMEALIAGVRAKGHDVRIGGELYGDALGGEGTPQGTYLGMFRHNVDTITEALQ